MIDKIKELLADVTPEDDYTLDHEKLHPLIRKIMNDVLLRSAEAPEMILLNALHYQFSIYINGLNNRIVIPDAKGGLMPMNTYAISFADSGSGKDKSLNVINSYLLYGTKEQYEERIKENISIAKIAVQEEIMTRELSASETKQYLIDHAPREPLFEIRTATFEGFISNREAVSRIGLGGTNVLMSEFGDMIEHEKTFKELLTGLVEVYDKGDIGAKATASNISKPTKNIHSNLLVFGSTTGLLDGGMTERKLMTMLGRGLARRSTFALPEKIHHRGHKDNDDLMAFYQNIKNEATAIKESAHYISMELENLLLQRDKHVTLSDEADFLYQMYKVLCEKRAESIVNAHDGYRAEVANRHWKTLKLSGIYSMLSGEIIVSEANMRYAIYYAEYQGHSVYRLFNQPDIYERLFNAMRDFGGEMIRTDFQEYPFWKQLNRQAKQEHLDLLNSFAYGVDYLLKIRTVDAVDFFSVVRNDRTTDDRCIISTSTHITENFEAKEVEFNQLHYALCSSLNYSAGTFKDGYRNRDNYEMEQNLIIIDVDDGMPMDVAKELFSEHKCLISTTKSHQKDKHGVVCDRYRVVFLSNRILRMSSADYSEFMSNVYSAIGLPADESCKDSSRFYYGSADADYWYSEGEKLLDVDSLIPNTKKEKEFKEHVATGQYDDSIGEVIGDAEREKKVFKEAYNASFGEGSLSLYKLMYWLKDAGISDNDILGVAHRVNDSWDEPMDERRFNRTLVRPILGNIG